MRYKLIGCEVFARPAYLSAANSTNTIDMEFTRLRSHLKPDELRTEIQTRIDATAQQYDAILLGFGICGNSTAGITAREIPLVIPRAHDCCTIFLGGSEAFLEHFGETPSAQWSNSCYYERYGGWYSDNAASLLSREQNGDYADLVEKYGEENAQYIWETLRIKDSLDFLTYIDLPGIPDNGTREEFSKHAAQSGKSARFLTGSTRLIERLLAGGWDPEEFLVVPPGSEIRPVYDFVKVMESGKKE